MQCQGLFVSTGIVCFHTYEARLTDVIWDHQMVCLKNWDETPTERSF